MLSSIVSAAVVSTVASATTTAGVTSMTISLGLPKYGVFEVIALVTLLSAKLMLSASTRWDNAIKCSLDMNIIPLMISFIAIIIYKFVAII